MFHNIIVKLSEKKKKKKKKKKTEQAQYVENLPPSYLPITKTYLCYFDPLKPHFYIVKLGYTRVYIIFLISAQKT